MEKDKKTPPVQINIILGGNNQQESPCNLPHKPTILGNDGKKHKTILGK